MILEIKEKFLAVANDELSSFHITKEQLDFASALLDPTDRGGRRDIKPTRTPLRQSNPFRLTCRQSTTNASQVGFNQKTGNSLIGATNPWSAAVQGDAGTPNINLAYWNLFVQDASTYVSARSLILDDITDLEMAGIVIDLRRELEQIAALSMVVNTDLGVIIQATAASNPVASGAGFAVTFTVATSAGFNANDIVIVSGNLNAGFNGKFVVLSTTATTVVVFYPTNVGAGGGGNTFLQDDTTSNVTGGSFGLRGLNQYVDGGGSAFGTSGPLPTAGLHTIATTTATTGATVVYNDLTALWSSLPAAYLQNPECKWHMHPLTIQAIRQLRDNQTLPLLLEVGDDDGGSVKFLFGHEVIPNSYIQTIAAGAYPIYFGDWSEGFEIVDHVNSIRIYNVTQFVPGTTQIFGEMRIVSSVINPFALTRLKT